MEVRMRFVAGFALGAFVAVSVFVTVAASGGAAQQVPTIQNQQTLTFMYDPKALDALTRAGGVLQAVWWRKGDKTVSLGQPRWIVPGRVRPAIYGDATEAEYYYFDQATGQKDGPFRPEVKK
jgi:hypothetical protein